MHRVLFEKKGDAVWLSHLDVMRIFQRAFLREHIPVAHTQGFSPHAFVSILLPLPVGTESQCEILECKLEDETLSFAQIQQRLNKTLPAGIHALAVYEGTRKGKELKYLQAQLRLEYDGGVPAGAVEQVQALFQRPELVVEKRSKKGVSQVDIVPMLQDLNVCMKDKNTLLLDCIVCAQDPSLNPMLLAAAIEAYLPEQKLDFAACRRIEVLDERRDVFR